MNSHHRLNHADRPSALVTAPPVAFSSQHEADWYTNAETGSRRLYEAIEAYRDRYERRAG